MKFANVTKLHRNPREAHERLTSVELNHRGCSRPAKAIETYHFRPTYAEANVGHLSSS